MPRLTKPLEAARIIQAMQVLQLITRGVLKKDACEMVGISSDQFENWIASGSDALEQLQNSIVEAERIRLAQISNAQAILLSNLITSVTTPGYADQGVQLNVLKYLDKLRGELEGKHGMNTSRDTADEYLMSGPQTRVEDSKMTVRHEMSRATVVNIKPQADGSVDLSIPAPTNIIDIFPALKDGDNSEQED